VILAVLSGGGVLFQFGSAFFLSWVMKPQLITLDPRDSLTPRARLQVSFTPFQRHTNLSLELSAIFQMGSPLKIDLECIYIVYPTSGPTNLMGGHIATHCNTLQHTAAGVTVRDKAWGPTVTWRSHVFSPTWRKDERKTKEREKARWWRGLMTFTTLTTRIWQHGQHNNVHVLRSLGCRLCIHVDTMGGYGW